MSKMNFKCPHCNVEIETQDRLDFSVESQEIIECEMLGSCPECGRTYTWFESYKYTRSYDFRLTD